MDSKKILYEFNDILEKLERLKYECTEDIDYSKETQFLSEVFNEIFVDKVPYMMRVQLIEFYKKYHFNQSEDGEWYSFNYKDKLEFRKLCEKIREELGIEYE